jgi:hypothetical protein
VDKHDTLRRRAGAKPTRLGVYDRPSKVRFAGPLVAALVALAVVMALLYLFFASSYVVGAS